MRGGRSSLLGLLRSVFGFLDQSSTLHGNHWRRLVAGPLVAKELLHGVRADQLHAFRDNASRRPPPSSEKDPLRDEMPDAHCWFESVVGKLALFTALEEERSC